MVLSFFSKDKIYPPSAKIGEYTILKMLGEGRYGICYLVCKKNRRYILKQLKKVMLKDIVFEKLVCEQEILNKIQCEAVPKFIEKLEFDDFSGYILEYKEGKTLEKIIYEDGYVFKRQEIYSIGIQLINILEYLHNLGVVHRDIRVPNVLYHNGKIYLLDFGLARWINHRRYTVDVDFSYLGDFLLHLYYTSFEIVDDKEKPWYEELDLFQDERDFFKRLMGITETFKTIKEVKEDFLKILGFKEVIS